MHLDTPASTSRRSGAAPRRPARPATRAAPPKRVMVRCRGLRSGLLGLSDRRGDSGQVAEAIVRGRPAGAVAHRKSRSANRDNVQLTRAGLSRG